MTPHLKLVQLHKTKIFERLSHRSASLRPHIQTIRVETNMGKKQRKINYFEKKQPGNYPDHKVHGRKANGIEGM